MDREATSGVEPAGIEQDFRPFRYRDGDPNASVEGIGRTAYLRVRENDGSKAVQFVALGSGTLLAEYDVAIPGDWHWVPRAARDMTLGNDAGERLSAAQVYDLAVRRAQGFRFLRVRCATGDNGPAGDCPRPSAEEVLGLVVDVLVGKLGPDSPYPLKPLVEVEEALALRSALAQAREERELCADLLLRYASFGAHLANAAHLEKEPGIRGRLAAMSTRLDEAIRHHPLGRQFAISVAADLALDAMKAGEGPGVGLYRKFLVWRVDGADAPGGKHDGCAYFVLDRTHDPHAIPALWAYAASCRESHPGLADDLEAACLAAAGEGEGRAVALWEVVKVLNRAAALAARTGIDPAGAGCEGPAEEDAPPHGLPGEIRLTSPGVEAMLRYDHREGGWVGSFEITEGPAGVPGPDPCDDGDALRRDLVLLRAELTAEKEARARAEAEVARLGGELVESRLAASDRELARRVVEALRRGVGAAIEAFLGRHRPDAGSRPR